MNEKSAMEKSRRHRDLPPGESRRGWELPPAGEDLRHARARTLDAWQRLLETRSRIFSDRETRRAALNLMEDAELARRAEHREAAGRQRADAALSESEVRLQLALDAAAMGTFVWNLQTDSMEPDARMLLLAGLARDDSTNFKLALAAMIHPDDANRYAGALARATDPIGQGTLREDIRIRLPDGTIRWLAITAQTQFASPGAYALRMVGAAFDVTARKQTEEVLRHSEAQLRTLFDETPLGVYLLDANLRICAVNPIARPVFGVIPNLIGRDLDEVLHLIWDVHYADELVQLFRRTLETGEPYIAPERAEHRRDRGVVEFYEWRISRITLPSGGYGVVCYFRDVSAQVAARQTILKSESKYRSLFKSIDEGFCVLEMIFDEKQQPADYRILEVNPAFERHSGLRNVQGKTILELIPDQDRHWFEVYGRVATTGAAIRFEDYSNPLNRWFDVYAFRIGRAEEHQVAVIFNDISERKRREANARFLAEFVADLMALKSAGEIARVAGRKIRAHFHLSHCVIEQIPELADEARALFQCSEDEPPGFPTVCRLKDFFTAAELRDLGAGRDVVVNDVSAAPRSPEAAARFAALNIAAVLKAPHVADGHWRFAINGFQAEPRVWRSDEVEFLRELSARVWLQMERARAHESMRHSEERLRAMIENLPGGAAFIVDRDLRYLLAEGEALYAAGFKPSDLVGKTIFEVLPAELAEDYAKFYRKALAGGTFETEHEAHGSTFVTRGTPLRSPDGGTYGVLAVSYDISRRKKFEQELRTKDELLTRVTEVTPTLLARCSKDLRYLFVNRAIAEFLNVPREKIIGRPIREIMGDAAFMTIVPYIEQVLQGKRVEYETEIHYKTAGRRFMHVTYTPERSQSDGSVVGWIETILDLSQRKQAEEELKLLNEHLEARVSERTAELDEANQTLRAEIKERKRVEENRRNLLRQLATAEEDERRRISRELHDEIGQHLVALTLGLKALSSKKTRSEVNLKQLQGIAELVGHEIHELALELRPTALDDLGLVRALSNYVEDWSAKTKVQADFHSRGFGRERIAAPMETALYRIAQEALTNVLKHAKASQVSLILERKEQYVALIVEDDGKGFDTDIFQKKSRKKLGVLGMGERAALLNGELTVESNRGKGTTVFVRIPLLKKEKRK